ncbi:hypothetical protein BASA50_011198 [Batrachochytrium salamandrivorans]|uniref:Uncharacterized protein n=1 Tax=Batrachochytrium salamandrivorans TaxID=1357716 RepID=A0ABQ8EW49_9FUNG|nr:hypothetical protein BASA50_011198 [Batrachochytrium salamandrivorans]
MNEIMHSIQKWISPNHNSKRPNSPSSCASNVLSEPAISPLPEECKLRHFDTELFNQYLTDTALIILEVPEALRRKCRYIPSTSIIDADRDIEGSSKAESIAPPSQCDLGHADTIVATRSNRVRISDAAIMSNMVPSECNLTDLHIVYASMRAAASEHSLHVQLVHTDEDEHALDVSDTSDDVAAVTDTGHSLLDLPFLVRGSHAILSAESIPEPSTASSLLPPFTGESSASSDFQSNISVAVAGRANRPHSELGARQNAQLDMYALLEDHPIYSEEQEKDIALGPNTLLSVSPDPQLSGMTFLEALLADLIHATQPSPDTPRSIRESTYTQSSDCGVNACLCPDEHSVSCFIDLV